MTKVEPEPKLLTKGGAGAENKQFKYLELPPVVALQRVVGGIADPNGAAATMLVLNLHLPHLHEGDSVTRQTTVGINCSFSQYKNQFLFGINLLLPGFQ